MIAILRFFTILTLAFQIEFVHAQDYPVAGYFNDALQFSQTSPGGSARYLGLGGASTALGADIGAASNNPAGLGMYKKSEFSISPAFNFSGSNTNYLGSSRTDSRQNFNIGNIGIVLASPVDEIVGGSWRGGAFSVTKTRINNFQNQYSFSGKNKQNSMTDYFAESAIANGATDSSLYNTSSDNYYNPFEIAYGAYLYINAYDPLNSPIKSNIPNAHTNQSGTIDNRGAQYQWDIAYGGNIQDKIYIGASIGIPTIRYISNKTYKETVTSADTNDLNLQYFTFTDYLKITGTGINFKVGLLLKPIDQLRIGLTLQTPTLYSVKTEYQYGVRSKFAGTFQTNTGPLFDISQKTVTQYFDYNLTTPARFKAGIAYFIGKHGFITGDAEVVPYRSSHLALKRNDSSDSDIDLFVGDNQYIQQNLKTAVNLNVGGEYRVGIFRLRAGAGLIKDPYNNSLLANKPKKTIFTYLFGKQARDIVNFSLGGGIRLPDYYFDVAFVNTRYNSTYSPYQLNNGQQPTAKIKTVNTNFVITFGAFF